MLVASVSTDGLSVHSADGLILDLAWESCEKGLANHNHILERSHMILRKTHPGTPCLLVVPF